MSMVPQIYDLEIDGERDVTQSDVHQLGAVNEAFGKMRQMAVSAGERLAAESDPVKRGRIAEAALGEIHFESSMAVRRARVPMDILAARADAEVREDENGTPAYRHMRALAKASAEADA